MEQERIEELLALAQRLREEGRALQGDGFGDIGHAKSAYKKVCKAIEDDLVPVLKRLAENKESNPVSEQQQLNPDCWGQGADNLPHCTCRLVFLNRR